MSHHYVPDREPAPYTEISEDEEEVIVNIADHEGQPESAVTLEHNVGQNDCYVIGEQEANETNENPIIVEQS